MEERVILVDEFDHETGMAEKLEVHERGILHRAFSIFIFNEDSEMLLQQRSFDKYHSPGLWTNACCSHPRPGELTFDAAERRLREELGFNTPLKKIFDFVYRADVGEGLIEHEFDHVFAGFHSGEIYINPDEIEQVRFVPIDEIEAEVRKDPGVFTAWFSISLPRVMKWWNAGQQTKSKAS